MTRRARPLATDPIIVLGPGARRPKYRRGRPRPRIKIGPAKSPARPRARRRPGFYRRARGRAVRRFPLRGPKVPEPRVTPGQLGRPEYSPELVSQVFGYRPYGPKSQEHSQELQPHKRQDNGMAFRWENGFVPEGQADGRQGRSAGNRSAKRVPSRRDGLKRCQPESKAEIGSIVPLGRAVFLMIPGTSCLATISLVPPGQKPCARRCTSHYPGAMGLQT